MPRNITVTFATLSFAGKVQKATESGVETSNFCVGQDGTTHDPSPVKQPRMCDHCGDLPAWGEANLVKGIKEGGGVFRILDAEELAKIDERYKGEHKGVIELVVHKADEFLLGTVPGESVNYVTPAQHGANQYQALVKLIEAHPDLAFVGLHTPQSRTHLYHIRAYKGVLLMEERVRQDKVRAVPEVAGGIDEKAQKMLDMLTVFLPGLISEYNPADYEDQYDNALASARAVATVITDSTNTESDAPTPSDNQVIELLERQMAKIKADAKARPAATAKKTVAARKTAAKKTSRKKVSA